jgi:Zn ribbon nucleic-acid-binding protein
MRCDSRRLSWWERNIGSVKCISCGGKMKRIRWPYSIGYECPYCKWVTWYKSKHEEKEKKNGR